MCYLLRFRHTLNEQLEGAAIFVDPDICFWENVEGWSFDRLMAGRLIPKYNCQFSGCLTHPRLPEVLNDSNNW